MRAIHCNWLLIYLLNLFESVSLLFFFFLCSLIFGETIIAHNLDFADCTPVVRFNIHCNLIFPILSYLLQNKIQKHFPIKLPERQKQKQKAVCLSL